MFETIYKFFSGIINWIFCCVVDENKKGLSLSRLIFLVTVIAAHYNWTYLQKDIPTYQFYFIIINLSYILFKDRALTIVSKIMDTVAVVKSPSVTNVTNVTTVAPTTSAETNDSKEEQLNG